MAISLRFRANSFFTGNFRISWNSGPTFLVVVWREADMHVRRDILFLAAVGVFLTGCDIDEMASFGNSHAYEKDFHQHYPLKSGGTLSLDSFNGSVEVSGWDEDRVQVDGVQYGSTERLR